MWYSGLIANLNRTGAKLGAFMRFMVFIGLWGVLMVLVYWFMRGLK